MNKEERAARITRRNKLIIRRYLVLSNKKYKTAKLYRPEAIWLMLEDEYHLSPVTIEKIVFSKD